MTTGIQKVVKHAVLVNLDFASKAYSSLRSLICLMKYIYSFLLSMSVQQYVIFMQILNNYTPLFQVKILTITYQEKLCSDYNVL